MGTTTGPLSASMRKLVSEKRESISISFATEESSNYNFPIDSELSSIISTNIDKVSLSALRSCFMCVLKQCMDQFYTLERIYSSATEHTIITEMPYLTMEERYGQGGKGIDYCLDCTYTNVCKLQKDVSVIVYLLGTCVEEMKKWGTTTLVREVMNNIERMRRDENAFITAISEKFRILRNIEWSKKYERRMSKTLVKTYSDNIRDTQRSALDSMERALAEVRYMQEWQASRYEQNKMMLKRAEEAYRGASKDMEWKISLENTCHDELERFILEMQNDYMASIQDLMDEYEKTLEQKEIQIYDLQTEMEKQKDHRELLKTMYEVRAQAMEDWLEVKRKKREKSELLLLQIAAAIKIQVWWRDVLVRRERKQKKQNEKRKGKGKDKTKSGTIEKSKPTRKGK